MLRNSGIPLSVLEDFQNLSAEKNPFHNLTIEMLDAYKSTANEKSYYSPHNIQSFEILYSRFYKFLLRTFDLNSSTALKNTAANRSNPELKSIAEKMLSNHQFKKLLKNAVIKPLTNRKFSEVSLNMGEAESIRRLFKRLVQTEADPNQARIELALQLLQYTINKTVHPATVSMFFKAILNEIESLIPDKSEDLETMLPEITVVEKEKTGDKEKPEKSEILK